MTDSRSAYAGEAELWATYEGLRVQAQHAAEQADRRWSAYQAVASQATAAFDAGNVEDAVAWFDRAGPLGAAYDEAVAAEDAAWAAEQAAYREWLMAAEGGENEGSAA
jgi:hypothetical protein